MSDERYEGPPKSHVQVWAEQALRQQEELLEMAMQKARREQMERDCGVICARCRAGDTPTRGTQAWWHMDDGTCDADAIRKAAENVV